MRILHVHSGGKRAEHIIELLCGESLEVISAGDFDSARLALDSRQYLNLIIIDFDSDKGLACDLLIFLRNNERYLHTPVIIGALSEPDTALERCLAFERVYLYDSQFEKSSFMSTIENAVGTFGKTIMLVDDEEMVREVLKTALEREGCRVIEASSGKRALELLEDNRADMIISDIQMPEGSGRELLEAVKAKYPDLPFFLISGYMGDCTNEDLIQSGADGLIAKPFKYAEIIAAVREGLEKAGVTKTCGTIE